MTTPTGSHLCPVSGHLPATDTQPDLTGPDGGDDEAAVMEHVEDLYDASRVSEDGDAGVRHGEVKGQEVCGLQGRPLPDQDKEDDGVPEPGQPACKKQTHTHSQIHTQAQTSPAEITRSRGWLCVCVCVCTQQQQVDPDDGLPLL